MGYSADFREHNIHGCVFYVHQLRFLVLLLMTRAASVTHFNTLSSRAESLAEKERPHTHTEFLLRRLPSARTERSTAESSGRIVAWETQHNKSQDGTPHILWMHHAAAAVGLKQRGATWRHSSRASTRHRDLERSPSSVILEVESAAAASSTAYHLQGDAALSTHAAFQQRQTLRRHPLVLGELQQWWEAAVELHKRQQDSSQPPLAQDAYIHIYRRISFDLLGEEDYKETDADAEALEEWEKDGNLGTTMERHKFMDAIFEVCDVYTESIDAEGTPR